MSVPLSKGLQSKPEESNRREKNNDIKGKIQ